MRLDLDWTLNTSEERRAFAEAYTAQHQEKLSADNLSTIADYVLWADSKQHGELGIEMTTKRSPWRVTKKEVSIDALFTEAEETGRPVDLLLQQEGREKKVANRLEREEVAQQLGANSEAHLYELFRANSPLLHGTTSQWIDLWSQIDVIEYEVQFWELKRGKRKDDKPIRKELTTHRLGLLATLRGIPLEDFRSSLEEGADEMEPYTFLRKKRLLVSLRQQQYQLLNALPTIGRGKTELILERKERNVEGVLPLEDEGLRVELITPAHFEYPLQQRIIKALRRMDNAPPQGGYVDLREVETVRALLEQREELEERIENVEIEQAQVLSTLLRYLDHYIMRAGLSDELLLVLQLKSSGSTNREVREALIDAHGLTYMENYISTIYTKRVLQAIAEEAKKHVRMLEYILMGRNVFKTCTDCHRLLPRNSEFFNKRGGTSDGFLTYCKECRVRRRQEKNKEVGQ